MTRELQSLLPMLPLQRWDIVTEQAVANAPIGAVYNHGPFDSSGYNRAVGLFYTESTAVFRIEFSFDDTNWDWIEEIDGDIAQPTVSLTPGAYRYGFNVPLPRMRIVVTNGGVIADLRYSCYLVPV